MTINFEQTGLGNYIHSHAENYKKYGISRGAGERKGNSFSGKKASFQEATDEAHEWIKNYLTLAQNNSGRNVDTTALEKLYNYMLGGKPVNQSQREQQLQQYLENHGQTVIAAFRQLHPGALIGNDLSVRATSSKAISKIQLKDTQKSIKKGTADKAITIIKKMKELVTDQKNRNTIVNQALTSNNINISSVVSQMNALQSQIQALMPEGTDNIQLGSGAGSMRSAIDDLNNMIDTYFANKDVLKGELFELFLNSLEKVGQQVFNKAEEDILEGLNPIGNKRTRVGYFNIDIQLVDNLRKKILEEQKLPSTVDAATIELANKFIISIKPSQTTVDVELNASNMSQEIKELIKLQENLTISAKNYSAELAKRKGFKIVESMSLLSVLQLLGTNFGNHYLNMLGNNISIGEDVVSIIKKTLAIRGLLGVKNDTLQIDGSDTAGVFITNTRSEGQGVIQVLTVHDILQKVINNPKLITTSKLPSGLNNTRVDDEISSYTKAKIRIVNLLVDAHAKKITAHLKISAEG